MPLFSSWAHFSHQCKCNEHLPSKIAKLQKTPAGLRQTVTPPHPNPSMFVSVSQTQSEITPVFLFLTIIKPTFDLTPPPPQHVGFKSVRTLYTDGKAGQDCQHWCMGWSCTWVQVCAPKGSHRQLLHQITTVSWCSADSAVKLLTSVSQLISGWKGQKCKHRLMVAECPFPKASPHLFPSVVHFTLDFLT